MLFRLGAGSSDVCRVSTPGRIAHFHQQELRNVLELAPALSVGCRHICERPEPCRSLELQKERDPAVEQLVRTGLLLINV